MATEDENLQRIAAAAIPHKLGKLYSRYGQPAPRLGEEMGAEQLGRSAPTLRLGEDGTAPSLGRARSESLQEPSEEERAARTEAESMRADLEEPRDTQGYTQGEERDAGDVDYESPEALAADHSNLMDGIRQLGLGDSTHGKVAADSSDMGPEDFWRLYGTRLEGQGITRDDFFAATGTEP